MEPIATDGGLGSLWHWIIVLVVIALLFVPGGPGDMMRRK